MVLIRSLSDCSRAPDMFLLYTINQSLVRLQLKLTLKTNANDVFETSGRHWTAWTHWTEGRKGQLWKKRKRCKCRLLISNFRFNFRLERKANLWRRKTDKGYYWKLIKRTKMRESWKIQSISSDLWEQSISLDSDRRSKWEMSLKFENRNNCLNRNSYILNSCTCQVWHFIISGIGVWKRS